MLTETITAISTGGIASPINIIRISGKDSLKIVNKIFTNAIKLKPNKIIYGNIINNKKETIDEVLVSYFAAPNSFTGEDICEINCHGGKENTLLILKEVLINGARLAEPGEFSKRAYINGKMDLSKAEAVIDLINAKTQIQAKIASAEIKGKIKENIIKLRDSLIDIIAKIEVSIDYPEYDYQELSNKELKRKLNDIKQIIEKMIKEGKEGKYIKEGVRVSILGKTNSGKSSLLNRLLEEEKAIVTDIEGTTRDVIEDTIIIENLVINIVDTAGIRQSQDIVETLGIKRSFDEINKADGIIYVIDSIKGIDKEDESNINIIKKSNKPIFYCFNKIDISRENIKKELKNNKEYIYISTITGEGIDALKEKILEKFKIIDVRNIQEKIIVNERQRLLLQKALDNIIEALDKNNKREDIDIIEINIKEANYCLGEIIGENSSTEIADRIFEKFCLGK